MTPVGIAWRLASESFADSWRLVLAGASTLVLGGTQLYLTWLVKEWVEGPFISSDLRELAPILTGAGVALATSAAALFCSRYLMAGVNQRIVERLRNEAVERLLMLDLAGARRFPSGEVLSRLLNDASQLSHFLNTMARRVVREGLVVSGALVMLFVLEWRWALVLSALVPAAGLTLLRFGAVIRRWGTEAQQAMGSLGATLSEQLHGFTTIKSYQAEDFEARRFAQANAAFRQRVMGAEYWSAVLLALIFVLVGLALLAVAYYGSRQMVTGAVSRGTLVAFLLYAGQMIEPIRRLSEIHAALQTTLAAAGRVYALVDLPRTEEPGGVRLSQPVRGEIAFERVSFAYRPAEPVLDSVSFSIAAREQVALVGATGVGKSTVAGLIVRFYEADAGRILLDGTPVGDAALDELRRAVCVVEQEPFLFSGPLVDNIRYGSWTAPRVRVEEAVRLAGLEPLAASLAHGLDSTLIEAGRDLSGGQRQRIALARALVRDPAVLVLDEATGAIDSQTETLIFDSLREWLARRTVIAISHRLATATKFPRVIVLHHGRVAGDGAPDALVHTCEVFADLFREQVDPLDGALRPIPGSARQA